MDTKINGGYILQPRKIDESNIMRQSPIVRELWFYLLRKVNWKEGNYPRGTNFFRFEDIQNDLCWYVGYRKMKYSKSQISKALRKLCERNAAETMKATRGIIITILNYNYYQDKKNYEGNDEKITKEVIEKHYTRIKIKEEIKEESKDSVYVYRAKKVFDFYLKKTNPTLITKTGAIQNIQHYLENEKYNTNKLMKAITNYSSVSGNHKKDPMNFFGTEGKDLRYFESYLQENFILPKKKKKKVSEKTKMTLNFALTDKFREHAIKNKIAKENILGIFESFKEYHKIKGEPRENWFLSWNTWIENAKKGWDTNSTNPTKPKISTRYIPEENSRGKDSFGKKYTTISI